jgi:membrane fusion protein (multidrug efflux system)
MRGSKIRRLFIVAILIVVGVGVVYNLFFKGSESLSQFKKQQDLAEETKKSEAQGQDSQALPVKTFAVAQFDFEDFHNNFGTLKGGLEFKLSSEIPGIIDTINYKEGEKYKKGALIMSLKQDDIMLRLKRSESKLNQALAMEDIAKTKFDDHKKLYEIGAIPESTLRKAELEYQSAIYEREGYDLQVRQDEGILEKSNIYAPSDGMVGELNVEEGEAITSNTLLGAHLLTEYVRAEFGVIEQEVNRISKGQPAFAYIDAYPNKEFRGVVDRISPIVTGSSRTANAEIKLPNDEGLLLPGMSARIKILLFSKKNAVVIPTEAVVESEKGSAVYCADEASQTALLRPVELEYSQSDYSVVASGLVKGELIIISSLDKVSPGSKIAIVEKQEL